MNTASLVQKAEAYLNIHLTHLPATAPPPGANPFITISREAGLGGYALAQMLAARLPSTGGPPWSVYSGNLIEEMLRRNDLPPHLARYLPDDKISELNASVGEIVGLHPNLWALVQKTTELMRQLARSGHVILLGRGARFATADIARGVHVRFVAPPDFRAGCLAERKGISLALAATQNVQRDSARSRYVKGHFGKDATDPTAYDLVINTAQVSPDSIAAIMGNLVTARAHAVTPPP